MLRLHKRTFGAQDPAKRNTTHLSKVSKAEQVVRFDGNRRRTFPVVLSVNFFGLDEPGPGLVRGKPDPEVKLGVAHDPGIRIRKGLEEIMAQKC